MARIEYLDFDLAVEATSGAGEYAVRVLASPKGEASGSMTFPLSADALENVILKLGRTRTGIRSLGSPTQQLARSFGTTLYDALFAGEIGTCFRRSLDEAEASGKGLRVRLRLADAPALADVPWEYLYLSGLKQFLVLSTHTPVVRYLDLPRASAPLTVQPPLKVLLVVASPKNLATLDVAAEVHRIEQALSGGVTRGLVSITSLPSATLAELRRALRRDDYHVLHFIGHGGFDSGGGEGKLAFEDEAGMAHLVSGGDLATMVHDHRTLRLVILNACEGARQSPTDPFSGVAQSLVQQGLPAVVAMQFEITDVAATVLSSELYAALADGYPIDAALAEARVAVFSDDNDVEWGTPVLYLRADDGRIFDVLPPPEPAPVIAPSEGTAPGTWQAAQVTAPAANVEAAPAEPDQWATPVPVGPPARAPQGTESSWPSGGAPPVVSPTQLNPGSQPTASWQPPGSQSAWSPTSSAPGQAEATWAGPYGVPGTGERSAMPSPSAGPFWPPLEAPRPPRRRRLTWWLVSVAVIAAGFLWWMWRLGGPEPAVLPPGATVTAHGESLPPLIAVPDMTALRGKAVVDGDTSDWPWTTYIDSKHLVSGPGTRTRGTWQLMWDDTALYFLVQVTDADVRLAQSAARLPLGDGVTLELGPVNAAMKPGDTLRPPDGYYLFGVPDVDGDARIGLQQPNADRTDFVPGNPPRQITAVATRTETGYQIEGMIPWAASNLNGAKAGGKFAANLNIVDSAASSRTPSLVSSNPQRLPTTHAHPAYWQLIVLQP